MLLILINEIDRTADLEEGSLSINNQIQQRSDTCKFTIFQGQKPLENEELKIYRYDTIRNINDRIIDLDGNFSKEASFFFRGQKLKINIGESTEETVFVESFDEKNLQIILKKAPSIAIPAGSKIGVLIFGGTISRVSDKNIDVLENIEYNITGTDYSKIFDKKLVSDTWEAVDSRYIINSFINSTVNFNFTIDDLDYDNNEDLQNEWNNLNDGLEPILDQENYIEGKSSSVFRWQNNGGTAVFEHNPGNISIKDLTKTNQGNPQEGKLMLWLKTVHQANIQNFQIRLGSGPNDYAEFTIQIPESEDWTYHNYEFSKARIQGNPDWTRVSFCQIFIEENGDGELQINGLRVNSEKSFTMFNVEKTPIFEDYRAPQLKPTALMQTLAKTWLYIWYIDYERDIYFIDQESLNAPYQLTDTSNNFRDLKVEIDQSQIGNRVIVRGGEKTSDGVYSQVEAGDSTKREWLLKNKFRNLKITVDSGNDQVVMEAGTTPTTIIATNHGLTKGDHIIQRNRGNVSRQILTVPDENSFTIEEVPNQQAGDVFTKFSEQKITGVEGIIDESTVDYVNNSEEKSVKATTEEATLTSGDFIRFQYNERIPIQIQYTDSASVSRLKNLGLGDGIFDLDPITNKNIDDTTTALSLAKAKVQEFSNPTITGSFKTYFHGLEAGQILEIDCRIGRNIQDSFVIQKITAKQKGGEFADEFDYSVSFGTTLFGIIEFYQKLLATKDRIEINTDDIVSTFVTDNEEVNVDDLNALAKDGGFQNAKNREEVELEDQNLTSIKDAGTWRFEPSQNQELPSRFDLADFG